jgi:hypothetical protein
MSPRGSIDRSWPTRSRVASSNNINFCTFARQLEILLFCRPCVVSNSNNNFYTSTHQPEILVFRYFHNLSLWCRWCELLVQLCCDAWLCLIISFFILFYFSFVIVIVAYRLQNQVRRCNFRDSQQLSIDSFDPSLFPRGSIDRSWLARSCVASNSNSNFCTSARQPNKFVLIFMQ